MAEKAEFSPMMQEYLKTKEEYNLLIQAINSAKNIRSHLEKVISESNTENKLYFGMSVKKKHTITVG